MTVRAMELLQDRSMTLGPARAVDEVGATAREFRHWRLARDDANVVWLLFDRADSETNILGREMLEELSAILDALESEPPAALVVRSAKPSGFCAGADIEEFSAIPDEAAVREQVAQGNEIFNRLEALPFTTIAVIHGYCVGGGLELVLACDYRLAVDGARMGFPEILLGLLPGLHGTVRFTRLLSPIQAMTAMLTGKNLHTARARRLGLVDAVLQERHVKNAVQQVLQGRVEHAGGGWRVRLLNSAPARRLLAKKMRSSAAEKAPPEFYPAPGRLIDVWEKHGGNERAMREAESEAFAELLFTDTARNLIRVYFLREKLRKKARGEAGIRHVHVIGAGTMGGDIAALCALSGLRVTLADVDNEVIADAVSRCAAMGRRKHLGSAELRDALDRLMPDPQGRGVPHADLIIEAAPEKVSLKIDIYRDLEQRMKPDALLATNTSSIPLQQLAGELSAPQRFLGIHFFNPVAVMQLVEVVSHDRVDTAALERATAFLGIIGKLPAPVNSAPGFLVNRCLTPYLMEAILMVDEGTAPETVDRAAERFGMPMGPLEVADQVGLDICVSVADVLREQLDTDIPQTPAWLLEKLDAGHLGRKSGRGIYEWKKGKPEKSGTPQESSEEFQDRLVLPLLNACAACLREEVVADADTLDGAMIFATGFAPFRGGPMHYAASRGRAAVADALEALRQSHGERFRPDPYWRRTEEG